jgi:hypothetical protein
VYGASLVPGRDSQARYCAEAGRRYLVVTDGQRFGVDRRHMGRCADGVRRFADPRSALLVADVDPVADSHHVRDLIDRVSSRERQR